jgi:hypothetical protein
LNAEQQAMGLFSTTPWEKRMLPHLEGLAGTMLKNRDFHNLKTVVDLLVGLDGPAWSQLSDEEKLRYLEEMQNDFHIRAMGDSVYGDDPNYGAIHDLIASEFRAVTRRV